MAFEAVQAATAESTSGLDTHVSSCIYTLCCCMTRVQAYSYRHHVHICLLDKDLDTNIVQAELQLPVSDRSASNSRYPIFRIAMI